jgi:hypothetical protein
MSAGGYAAMPLGMRNLSSPFAQMPGMAMSARVDAGKGKGKAISAEDFEAAFAEAAGLVPAPQGASRFTELDDTADLSAAMAEATLESKADAQKDAG